jgi:hypothetical protein
MARQAFVKFLEEHDQITIAVEGRRSERIIANPVWFVLHGGSLWLLPVRGSRTEWYRNLLVSPRIKIQTGREELNALARTVDDPKTVKLVVEWFKEKYTSTEIARYYTGLDVAVEVPNVL